MNTYHLHIEGRVQGVGFRPRVYQLAREMNLSGNVSNGLDGLHVRFNADNSLGEHFRDRVVNEAPELAIITRVHFAQVDDEHFDQFLIVESTDTGTPSLKVSPDFALCADCRYELSESSNQRFGYAFITCTSCGPRYSITESLPYDRPATSMKGLEMCASCHHEYDEVQDRRHFSQTNSCPDCGVSMQLFVCGQEQQLSQEAIIETTVASLTKGEIAAVKGIGGYLLLCDATNADAIDELRKRKHRPEKPLALMYPDMLSLSQDFKVSEAEHDQLLSTAAPIVILNEVPGEGTALATDSIAPGLNRMAVMLPYAPQLYLIAQRFGRPLVATSANISGSPIIFEDQMALDELQSIADVIVTHNRPIVTPQDDSVLRMVNDTPILIRRSRGFAPAFFGEMPGAHDQPVLALGAQMKGSIALSMNGDWQVSQFLGSLESYEAQLMYRQVLSHLSGLFQFKPGQLVTDLHPAYYSHLISDDFAEPVNYVQHHEAHFAAVLQENQLIDEEVSVLGVIWDGTGWGHDEVLWGGEFFSYRDYEIDHLGQLSKVPQLSGDKMAREPRLSALSFFGDAPALSERISKEFTQQEWGLFQKLLSQPTRYTSSIGRLFDAMAALLGLKPKASYEGQAAMLLEQEAMKCKADGLTGYSFDYHQNKVGLEALKRELSADLSAGRASAEMAMRFHIGLVDLIAQVAQAHGLKNIAFSGGVFQNALLVSLVKQKLSAGHQLYFHKQLSPNDENVSFGQLAHFFMQQKRKEFLDQNKEAYVFSNSR